MLPSDACQACGRLLGSQRRQDGSTSDASAIVFHEAEVKEGARLPTLLPSYSTRRWSRKELDRYLVEAPYEAVGYATQSVRTRELIGGGVLREVGIDVDKSPQAGIASW